LADIEDTIVVSKLEQSKAKRRNNILDAARALLKQQHGEELSMRILAKLANVSLATPYNLFGSKRGIMLALLKREGELFITRLNEESLEDPLDRIFQFLDSAFDLYRSDPSYFKLLLGSLYITDDTDLRQDLRRPRVSYLKRQLREATALGLVGTEISIGLVSRQIIGLHLFFLQEWLCGTITLERARLETEYGVSVLLLALTKDENRSRLLARNQALEAQIE
jgi:AcrR family transcriptional regulator